MIRRPSPIRLVALFVAACLVADLFPWRGPPDFRYTGSDPTISVWNLGWPLATAIYDSRNGFHVGPWAYIAGAAQLSLFAIIGLALAAIRLLRRNARGI